MASITKRKKVFRVRWLDHERKRFSASFDTHREAQEFARRREVETDEIKLGIKSPIPLKKTMNEAFDYWLLNRAVNKRSHSDDVSIIKAHLRPSFGHLLVRQLSAIHTDRYTIEKNVKLNIKTISNHLTLLISILNMCVDIGWSEKAPKIQKPKVKLFSKEYRFLRTDKEIEDFLLAAKAENKLTFLLYKLAINTGLREGELAALDWVIVGGESGPGARPMKADWVTDIRDQCVKSKVAFFFKQWGGVRKDRTGRVLDGRTWDEFPSEEHQDDDRGVSEDLRSDSSLHI